MPSKGPGECEELVDLRFKANGQAHTFHIDDAGQVILCASRGSDEIFIPL